LAAEASERTIYLRESGGHYLPLVTSANVAAGVKFGVNKGFEFISATPDLSHVVLRTTMALTKVAAGTVRKGYLYEWESGQLHLVSVLPSGAPAEKLDGLGDEFSRNARLAIANDGSRVIFESGAGGPGPEQTKHLYIYSTSSGETIQVDKAQGVSEPLVGEPQFQMASSYDARVFFTDAQNLVPGATGAPNERDLYVLEVTGGSGGQKLGGNLIDIAKPVVATEHMSVEGLLPGGSEDGSYAYLVARGVLTNRENAAKEKAVHGGYNLYMLHRNGTEWEEATFIARLDPTDSHDWQQEYNDLGNITSRVAPNGEYLAFMSDRSLTGYDNIDVNSGEADEEVYLYQAQSDRLICASCNPTGAKPTGVYEAAGRGPVVDRRKVWEERWLSGNIPGWTSVSNERALYQSRYLANSGRLFFNSAEGLVTGDTNKTWDVYEYEPSGVGDCTNASQTFQTASDGCVALISSGTSSQESAFMDASESGNDVFFLTGAQLVREDEDGAFDVYDAHVCEAAAPCAGAAHTTPPPCATAQSCKQPVSSPFGTFGAPASATFSGAGNLGVEAEGAHAPAQSKALTRAQKLARALKACRAKKARTKQGRKRRASCEARARAKYGPRKAKKSSAAKGARHSSIGPRR
jgi:YD repeat-containing protein